MGFFSTLFRGVFSGSDGSEKTVTVREKTSDNSVVRGDRYTSDGDKSKHTHEGYNLDKTTGSYRQYGGGENSDDRNYNKK